MSHYSRKHFLNRMGLGALGVGVLSSTLASCDNKQATAAQPEETADSLSHPLALGMTSYTLRKFSLDEAIAMTLRLGLKHICLKSMHLPLESTPEEIAAAAAKVRDAGLDLYGGGVIYMKTEAEVEQAFAYAKAAGMRVVVGVPTHELLSLVEQKVKETDVRMAIHNHGPGDDLYSSPDDVWAKIKDLDERVGFCIDIGHVVRINQDPIEKIEKYADRLYDMHFKDVEVAAAEGSSQEVGRGIIDIPGVFTALKKVRYSGIVGIEYEKDGDDPLPGVAESVGYANGILKMLS